MHGCAPEFASHLCVAPNTLTVVAAAKLGCGKPKFAIGVASRLKVNPNEELA